jgi:flavin reductase (DIM6/NTAB) family NADH-FMN oxidoreductase RutF
MVPVSAEPPLLLVCVAKTSDTLAFLDEASSFVVNIMAPGAGPTVSRLATKSPDKFRGIAWQPSPVTANPIIRAHRSAFLDCVVTERITAGDHYIFIGRIVAGEQQADVEPLLYFRRQFHRLGPASAEPTASAVRSTGPTSDTRGA